jgi:hypothetical protein
LQQRCDEMRERPTSLLQALDLDGTQRTKGGFRPREEGRQDQQQD